MFHGILDEPPDVIPLHGTMSPAPQLSYGAFVLLLSTALSVNKRGFTYFLVAYRQSDPS
jgi:hypothetical protein